MCSLNQRLVFPEGPNNQNTVKKMILIVKYNIFTDPKGSKKKIICTMDVYGETFYGRHTAQHQLQ